MRYWVGCKKFRVDGYTNSDIDLVCTTTGYTRPISLPVYTTARYISSDTDHAYTATGYASNDTDLGCTTIADIEFTALGRGKLGIPAGTGPILDIMFWSC